MLIGNFIIQCTFDFLFASVWYDGHETGTWREFYLSYLNDIGICLIQFVSFGWGAVVYKIFNNSEKKNGRVRKPNENDST